MILKSILAALIVVWANGALADTKSLPDASRGELLYTTHCVACHTSQVHWRDKKMVTDWTSMELQVRRWAANEGLSWSNADVTAVGRYLNTMYYHFPARPA